MDCGKTIEELVPLVAAVKLSKIDGVEAMSDKELLIKFSEIMWDMETAYHDVAEHEGFQWYGFKSEL